MYGQRRVTQEPGLHRAGLGGSEVGPLPGGKGGLGVLSTLGKVGERDLGAQQCGRS